MAVIVNVQEYRIMIIIINIQEYHITVVIACIQEYLIHVCKSERDQGIPALALLANDKDLDQLANSQPDQGLCRLLSIK